MIHTSHGSRCCACHIIHACDERISSTLSAPFPSTSSSSHSSCIFCTSSCTSSTTLRAVASLSTPPKRVWTLLTTPTSVQVMSLRPQGDRSSPTQGPWLPLPPFSLLSSLSSLPPIPTPSPLPPAVPQARVPRGRRVWWHRTRGYASRTHRVHVYHSQREGLSVGQSSSSMSERTERLVGERTGGPVGPIGQELKVGNAQIRIELCWTDRQSEFSPNVERKLRNTNSRLIMKEEVYENEVKLLNLSKKNFTALKLKNYNDEINNFFMNGCCSKIRNYVKVIIKVSMKWKN